MKSTHAWILPFTLAACSSSDSNPDAQSILDAALDAGIDAGLDAGIDAGIDGGVVITDAGTDCVATMPPTTLYQDFCMIGELEMCLFDVNRGPR